MGLASEGKGERDEERERAMKQEKGGQRAQRSRDPWIGDAFGHYSDVGGFY